MSRKPPLKLKSSPAVADDDGAALAKRLESSRALYKPAAKTQPATEDKFVVSEKKQARNQKKVQKTKVTTKAVTPNIPNEVGHYTFAVSVPPAVDQRVAREAKEKGLSLAYLRKAIVAKARTSLSQSPNTWSDNERERFVELMNSGREKREHWTRVTVTLAPDMLQELRDLASDELNIHSPTTLVSTAMRTLVELAKL